MSDQKVAVVSGGNRGMGFALCRALAEQGFHVVLGSRSATKGEDAAQQLRDDGLHVESVELDVIDQSHINSLADMLREKYGRVDVLVNNAGILVDDLTKPVSIFDANPESIMASFETNTLAPILLTTALMRLMREQDYGRVVNVSSGMGRLEGMGGCHAGYRISKTALNSATGIFAAELAGSNIKINAMCPGWVRTDMGGGAADRSIEEGIDTMLWLATLPDDGPSGGFFRDRAPMSW